MAQDFEMLELAAVAAIARDSLMRAGATPPAAEAAAWAIRMAERDGARAGGLMRLARLLEGLRMGAIDGAAPPAPVEAPPGQVRLQARGGLSDGALARGIDRLEDAARDLGAALLAVTGCGDGGYLPVWTGRLAEAGLVALALPGAEPGCLALPRGPGPAPPTLPVGQGAAAPWAAALVSALAGTASAAAGPAADMPFDRPHQAALCLIALVPAATRGSGVPGLAAGADKAARRHQADTAGVAVPTDLLQRIINA